MAMKFTTLFKHRLSRFEKAVRNHEFRGANDPQDWPAIDAEYKRSHNLVIHCYADMVDRYERAQAANKKETQ